MLPVPPAWASNIRSERAAAAAARELEAMKCPSLSKARGILSKKKIKGQSEYLVHWWPQVTSLDETELGPTRWISREVLGCSRLCVSPQGICAHIGSTFGMAAVHCPGCIIAW